MPWNWQLSNWPQFTYNKELIIDKEKEFLLKSGGEFAWLKSLSAKECHQFIVEILSIEGLLVDGNGRIGRVLIEKMLSQRVGQPQLIAVSARLEKRKKEYYGELEKCNRTLQANDFVKFFAKIVLEAQEDSLQLLFFLIEKVKMLINLSTSINERQEKALLTMFAEGPKGFQGGLSAENYIAITKTSRATATRDLSDLVQKGALTKTGELKHSRYWLNIP